MWGSLVTLRFCQMTEHEIMELKVSHVRVERYQMSESSAWNHMDDETYNANACLIIHTMMNDVKAYSIGL